VASVTLLDFQTSASELMANRVIEYMAAPISMGRGMELHRVPFLQALNSITASGKTLILADAVSAIAQRTVPKPIVLWLSKASVVVAQSYANLAPGGSYHDLLDNFEVRTLSDYSEEDLATSASSFLYFATVGTFNQRQRADSALNVFKSAIDDAAASTWESLKLRPDENGFRRPLFVLYDEAHNLSDQQTELLLELDPDAFLLATATSRLPQKFAIDVIAHLKSIGKFEDKDLVVAVDAAKVSAAGLVKSGLTLIGRQAAMESVLTDLFASLTAATKDARVEGLAGLPKAVYVCKTNVNELTGEADSAKQPFGARQAPPILIWRYLVNDLKINPSEIAVYCDLKTHKDFPLPPEFILFNGKDKDYDRFVAGRFRHIVFNQSLQEGWDDPLVYFAYIDKSMGSKVQAEQVAGRLLRQPGLTHYRAERLNTAEIYVRVEAKGVFEQVVKEVDAKITSGGLAIKLNISKPGSNPRTELVPRGVHTIPITSVMTNAALGAIEALVASMTDYTRDDGTNTSGTGIRTKIQRIVGEPGSPVLEWEEYGESASVLARWMFQRELELVNRGALGLVVTSNSDGTLSKFDAKVGFGSRAEEHIKDVARKVGMAYADEAYLKLRKSNPYEIGSVMVDMDTAIPFENAIHLMYDGLNPLEESFAQSIDTISLTWCRNPSQSGYRIPLIEPGRTWNFFPDFIVWSNGNIFAIDTKGPQLHQDAARKLVDIKPANGDSTRLFVRFVSAGKVSEGGPQPEFAGYTAWSFKPNGSPRFTHCEDMLAAIKACLEPGV